MAKLSTNGTEVLRVFAYRANDDGSVAEAEYSLRSTGAVLRKTRTKSPAYGRSAWGTWKHVGKIDAEDPAWSRRVIQDHAVRRGWTIR